MGTDKNLRKRILLVEDNARVRASIASLLQLNGHAVTEARNGKEALELFSPGHFDLVITDYSMPEMPGDQLASSIKRLVPSQPILLITSYAHRLRALDHVDAVLEKPFTVQEFCAALDELLG